MQLYKSGKAIARARSRLTEKDNSVYFNNCESFVNWAPIGEDVTYQGKVEVAATGSGVGAVVAVGIAVVGAVVGAVVY